MEINEILRGPVTLSDFEFREMTSLHHAIGEASRRNTETDPALVVVLTPELCHTLFMVMACGMAAIEQGAASYKDPSA